MRGKGSKPCPFSGQLLLGRFHLVDKKADALKRLREGPIPVTQNMVEGDSESNDDDISRTGKGKMSRKPTTSPRYATRRRKVNWPTKKSTSTRTRYATRERKENWSSKWRSRYVATRNGDQMDIEEVDIDKRSKNGPKDEDDLDGTIEDAEMYEDVQEESESNDNDSSDESEESNEDSFLPLPLLQVMAAMRWTNLHTPASPLEKVIYIEK